MANQPHAASVTAPLDPRIARCRKLVTRKALLAAGAALVPIPGLDVAADVALLTQLIGRINLEFGLTEAQIEALAPSRRALVYKGIQLVGSSLIGSSITRDLVLVLLRQVSTRLTAQQVSKYIPLAGQAASATLAYVAMRYVCNQHIADCAKVSAQLRLAAPDPDGTRIA